MDVKDFTELGIEKIQEIFDQGWNDLEFIEIVFREWSKINQKKLDTEYTRPGVFSIKFFLIDLRPFSENNFYKL